MKKNLVQKKESSLSVTQPRHGIRRTRDRRCGSCSTPRSRRARRSEYSHFPTGQRLIYGSYIERENIEIPSLYFAKERPVVYRDGNIIMVDDDRMKLRPGEKIEMKSVRFRTLGCYPLTGGVESTADTLPEIIEETLSAVSSERTTRVIDNEAAGSMERRKREGYF